MNYKEKRDIIEWDIENWSKTLEFWGKRIPEKITNALALGERNGGISLWLALNGMNVICSDRTGPLDLSKLLHCRYSLNGQIEYKDVDIFSIPYPDNHFDIVACKSVIGGLKMVYKDGSTRTLTNQKIAVEEVRRVLKPGGHFLGAENLIGTKLHKRIRKWKKNGKLGWRHLTPQEVRLLFSDFSKLHQKTYGFMGTYYSSRILNSLTGMVDQVLSPILPENWKYISFIVAKK